MPLSLTVDASNRQILWVSPGLLRELDIDGAVLVGRSLLDLVDPTSIEVVEHLLTRSELIDLGVNAPQISISRPFGSIELQFDDIRHIDRLGSHVVLCRFRRRAANGPDLPAVRRSSPDLPGSDAVAAPSPPPHGSPVPGPRADLDPLRADELTGLPLRAGLLARLDAAPLEESSVVVVIDLDAFARLNARLGNSAGDDILAEVGDRLAMSVRRADFAARLSGDRFVVHGRVDGLEEAHEVADHVQRVMTDPFEVDGSLISVAASIGVAWGPNSPVARVLFDHAEVALGEARANGGRQLCFFAGAPSTGKAALEAFSAEMREALATGQIHVAYQPIVELSSGRLEKLEALARWDHPVRGSIPPVEFIPMAERSGTIVELGEWILDRSCADVARLAAYGLDAEISVNISVIQLRQPDITSRIAAVLERHQIEPGRVWIEVTESVLLDDRALAPLHRLHDLGIHLVVDDFGTGYASFQYLTRLAVDALKIDTSFVKGLGIDASDTAIVRSVINLGRELGLQVVAEGVETESQRAQLIALDCRLAQGWLFSRALPFDELVARYGRGLGRVPVLPLVDAAIEEARRIEALRACKILDTPADPAFDSVVRLATQLLSTPIGLVSLLDVNRQWFKARVGVELTETSREVSFCNHAIARPREPLVIDDALLDQRFAGNPLVVGGPSIRAYAGVPIRSREGLVLGTLCVLDVVPRHFTDEQVAQLAMLAEQTGAMLDLRRRAAELNDLLHNGHGRSDAPVIGQVSPVGQAEPVAVTMSERDGAAAVGQAVVELTRISERRDDTPGQPANVLNFGALQLRLSARAVSLDGVDIDVSAKEFDLLAFLSTNAGRAYSRIELLREVWHSTPDWQNPATVTEHIYRLRSKIEVDPATPRLLQTVRGVGYRFEASPGESNGEAQTAQSDPRSGEFVHDDTHIVAADAGMLDLMMTDEPSDLVGRDVLDVIAPSSHPAAHARREMRASGHAPGPQVISLVTTTGTEVVTMMQTEDQLFHELPAVVVSVREILDPPHLMRQLVNGVVNEVSDAVIVTDPQLHVLAWNPAAERLYGWSEREVLGHTLQNVVRALQPFDLATVRAEVERSGRWVADADHVTRDGTIVEVVSTLNVICDETGAVTSIVAVNRPQRQRGSVLPVLGHSSANRADVRRAVNRSEFVVYYEPVVRLVDRVIVAVNVRVRWLRPDGGTWDLVDFVRDVEHADALGDLARYVYPTAFLQFERWQRSGRSIELVVDVSANQLADEDFLDVLAPVIVRLRVAGSRLWLRVGESELRMASRQTREALDSLSAAGALIAVGALGSGWATPERLEGFHVNALALNVSAVSAGASTAGGASPADVIVLGATMSVPVWVDGVAEQRDHDAAAALGCTVGSGPLYGSPTLGDHLDVGRSAVAPAKD